MEAMQLSLREDSVLQALVRAYIDTDAPIGSQTLLQREKLGISPATVRNTLARLEEKGFLRQPHTSAGRVPTARGYRHYARQCTASGEVWAEAVAEDWRPFLENAAQEGNFDEIMGQLAKIIGDVSLMLGLVLAPGFEQGVFDKLELVRLGDQRLLLVVGIDGGVVKTLVLEVESCAPQRALESLSQRFNERLHGLTVAEIRRTAHERLQALDLGDPQLVRVVMRQICTLSLPQANDLHIAGAGHICLQPEFRDPMQVAGLMELVEGKQTLARLLRPREGVVITIGAENGLRQMHAMSVVTASYDVGGIRGVIGVMGPMRMPYARMVALVNSAAAKAANLAS